MATDNEGYLETPSVLRLAGIAYSTLDYWVRTGLVVPSVRAGGGKRLTRRWSVLDVVCVRALKELRDAGASVHMMVRARERLEERWSTTLTARLLFWDGADLVLIDEWENLISLVQHPGQSALRIVALPIDAYAREAAGELIRINADGGAIRATG